MEPKYVIVTVIGNMSSCNWDIMSTTLSKILDFYRPIFQNIQLTVTFNYIDCHSSLELVSLLELHPSLITRSVVDDIVLWLFK